MMNAEKMLLYLENISNANLGLNILNHMLLIVCVILCFTRIRHKKLVIAGTCSFLFLSLIGNAFYYGNVFHAITFGSMLITLVITYNKMDEIQETPKINFITINALLLFIAGIWYPEFVHTNNLFSFLLSPVGIVPCPTLLCTTAIMNFYPGKKNKKFFICVICFTVLYGIIGTFVFKVYYDVLLLIAALLSGVNLYINSSNEGK